MVYVNARTVPVSTVQPRQGPAVHAVNLANAFVQVAMVEKTVIQPSAVLSVALAVNLASVNVPIAMVEEVVNQKSVL